MARKDAAQRAKNPATEGLTPSWWVPTSLGLMIIGLLWVITYYVSSGSYPVTSFGDANILAGFGFILVGFIMLTRWK